MFLLPVKYKMLFESSQSSLNQRETNLIVRHYEIHTLFLVKFLLLNEKSVLKLLYITLHVHFGIMGALEVKETWQYFHSTHEPSPCIGLIYIVISAPFCFPYLFPFFWQLPWTDCISHTQGSCGVFTNINMLDSHCHILVELCYRCSSKYFFNVLQKKGSHWFVCENDTVMLEVFETLWDSLPNRLWLRSDCWQMWSKSDFFFCSHLRFVFLMTVWKAQTNQILTNLFNSDLYHFYMLHTSDVLQCDLSLNSHIGMHQSNIRHNYALLGVT